MAYFGKFISIIGILVGYFLFDNFIYKVCHKEITKYINFILFFTSSYFLTFFINFSQNFQKYSCEIHSKLYSFNISFLDTFCDILDVCFMIILPLTYILTKFFKTHKNKADV